jgi:hypothetical protein
MAAAAKSASPARQGLRSKRNAATTTAENGTALATTTSNDHVSNNPKLSIQCS